MSEEGGNRAREAGAATVQALRRAMARKAADLIRSDPDDAATALEIGLVDREWLDEPGSGPISSSAPADILRRFLERSVERRPSKLSSLGLSAVQLLSSGNSDGVGGTPQPITVVFTDLEGFTAFTDARGDAAAIALIDEHHKLANPIVRRWNGRVVKHLGDGLLCTFGSPETGLRAALELLGTAPPPLRLRAGVHVGEATVTRGDIVGHVVNLTARVCEHARGGQVWCTAEVHDATGPLDGVHFGRIKARRLKGIKVPVGLCEATAVSVPTTTD
ncbi:MAG TPA: adenylate/guanylate cyclase domain-containing protein [Acidimicrobiales bacterium]|nr:adenylate/guanylate cyclase domain-containing protein [Acidimicrobiales bacterium]